MNIASSSHLSNTPRVSLMPPGERPEWANGKIPMNIACRLDRTMPSVEWKSDDFKVSGQIVLQKGVPIFPVCRAGITRSQIVYRLAEELGCETFCPHGVHHGPRARFASKVFEFEPLPEQDEFEQVLGEQRVWRVGEPADSASSWQIWAKTLWFDPLIDDGGHVIVSHDAAFSFVGQLQQFAGARSLERVRVSPVAFDDPSILPDPHAYDKFVDAVRGLLTVVD